MTFKAKRKEPEIIFRGGKPAAVILDIEAYREMLERLEDAEDLKVLTANPIKLVGDPEGAAGRCRKKAAPQRHLD